MGGNDWWSVEVFNHGWKPGSWAGLKMGTIFRLRGPEGELCDAGREHEVCVAASDATPYLNEQNYSVQVVPITVLTMDSPYSKNILLFKEEKPLGLIQKVDFREGLAYPLEGEPVAFDHAEVRDL